MLDTIKWYTREGAEVQNVFEIKGETARVMHRSKCMRCGGAGGYQGWPGFTCYRCGGSGWEAMKNRPAYTRTKLDALNAKQGAARKAKADAQKAKWFTQKRERRVGGLQFWNDHRPVLIAAYEARHRSPFLKDMLKALITWGNLTERQLAGVEKTIAAQQKRDEEMARARKSEHVGTKGERTVMYLTAARRIEYTGQYGMGYITIANDDNGNVYKTFGVFPGGLGERIRVKATIKDHEVYKDIKTTIITRVKLYVEK